MSVFITLALLLEWYRKLLPALASCSMRRPCGVPAERPVGPYSLEEACQRGLLKR